MSKIDDLIKNFCPNGANILSLNKICLKIFSGGTPNTKKQEYYNGEIPWLRSGEINFNTITKTDMSINREGFINSSAKWIKEKSVLMAMTGATVAKVAVNEITLTTNQSCACIEVNPQLINYKFLFYYLANNYQVLKGRAQGAMSSFNLGFVKQIEVPVPPLEVQNEIVRILDNFSALEAELEAELEARTKQYEFYLNKLLDFSSGFVGVPKIDNMITEMCPSGIASIKIEDVILNTTNIRWNETDRTYKYIDLSSVDRVNHSITEVIQIDKHNAPSRAQKIVRINDVIFGTTRPLLRRFCIIPMEYDGQICSTGYCVLRADERKVLPKFLFYQLSLENFYSYIESVQQGSAYPAVSDSLLKSFDIFLPPISIQKEIVDILDNFSTYVTSLTKGLPAEIAARRQQYEYYRNKLLTY